MKIDDFPCKRPHPIEIASSPSILDLDIVPVLQSKFLKLFLERSDLELRTWIVESKAHEDGDPPCLLGLLCLRRERPRSRRRTPDKRYEFASLHAPREDHAFCKA